MTNSPRRYDPLGRLNVVCPYYTMFPLDFPLRALRDAPETSLVLDPFCGRGTTLYAARLRGLTAVGIDSNRVAVAIAAAKLSSVSAGEILSLSAEILQKFSGSIDLPDGEFWKWCYHPDTLVEICILRGYFLSKILNQADIVLRALVLGLLHGPRTNGRPSYLSNQMPRTYATKPDAAVDFWEKRNLRPRRVNTLDMIRRRAEYILEQLPPHGCGRVYQGDIRSISLRYGRRFTHVITSPPYVGMRCYVSDQWLRNWFLGAGDDDVQYDQSQQLGSRGPEVFLSELGQVWRRVARVCRNGAKLVVRFGAIPSIKQNPGDLLRHSLIQSSAPWKVTKIRAVPPPTSAARQANQFTPRLRDALQELDLHAVLEG